MGRSAAAAERQQAEDERKAAAATRPQQQSGTGPPQHAQQAQQAAAAAMAAQMPANHFNAAGFAGLAPAFQNGAGLRQQQAQQQQQFAAYQQQLLQQQLAQQQQQQVLTGASVRPPCPETCMTLNAARLFPQGFGQVAACRSGSTSDNKTENVENGCYYVAMFLHAQLRISFVACLIHPSLARVRHVVQIAAAAMYFQQQQHQQLLQGSLPSSGTPVPTAGGSYPLKEGMGGSDPLQQQAQQLAQAAQQAQQAHQQQQGAHQQQTQMPGFGGAMRAPPPACHPRISLLMLSMVLQCRFGGARKDDSIWVTPRHQTAKGNAVKPPQRSR